MTPGGDPTNAKMQQVSSNLPEKCPVALYPKLREKNCACDEHRVPGWEGLHRHPRGNDTQAMNQENVTVPRALPGQMGSRGKKKRWI